MAVDILDSAWLPPYVPDDVLQWDMHPRSPGGHGFASGFIKVRGTRAYEFVCVADGRAIEILAHIDGMMTHHWRRDPIDGTWPGTYDWAAVEIRGQGLVRGTE
jgi:hypothetical protein